MFADHHREPVSVPIDSYHAYPFGWASWRTDYRGWGIQYIAVS